MDIARTYPCIHWSGTHLLLRNSLSSPCSFGYGQTTDTRSNCGSCFYVTSAHFNANITVFVSFFPSSSTFILQKYCFSLYLFILVCVCVCVCGPINKEGSGPRRLCYTSDSAGHWLLNPPERWDHRWRPCSHSATPTLCHSTMLAPQGAAGGLCVCLWLCVSVFACALYVGSHVEVCVNTCEWVHVCLTSLYVERKSRKTSGLALISSMLHMALGFGWKHWGNSPILIPCWA